MIKVSQVAQVVKNLPANTGDSRDRWVQSLGQEDPLGEHLAAHSSILAWRIPRTEEFRRQQSIGSPRVGLSDRAHLTMFSTSQEWQVM